MISFSCFLVIMAQKKVIMIGAIVGGIIIFAIIVYFVLFRGQSQQQSSEIQPAGYDTTGVTDIDLPEENEDLDTDQVVDMDLRAPPQTQPPELHFIDGNQACVLNETYGALPENKGVWVDKGCNGSFIYNGKSVDCASNADQRRECEFPVDLETEIEDTTSNLDPIKPATAELIEQTSTLTNCTDGITFGAIEDGSGVWIDKGCTGRFSINGENVVCDQLLGLDRQYCILDSVKKGCSALGIPAEGCSNSKICNKLGIKKQCRRELIDEAMKFCDTNNLPDCNRFNIAMSNSEDPIAKVIRNEYCINSKIPEGQCYPNTLRDMIKRCEDLGVKLSKCKYKHLEKAENVKAKEQAEKLAKRMAKGKAKGKGKARGKGKRRQENFTNYPDEYSFEEVHFPVMHRFKHTPDHILKEHYDPRHNTPGVPSRYYDIFKYHTRYPWPSEEDRYIRH